MATRKPKGKAVEVRDAQITEDEADALFSLRRLRRGQYIPLDQALEKLGCQMFRPDRRRRAV